MYLNKQKALTVRGWITSNTLKFTSPRTCHCPATLTSEGTSVPGPLKMTERWQPPLRVFRMFYTCSMKTVLSWIIATVGISPPEWGTSKISFPLGGWSTQPREPSRPPCMTSTSNTAEQEPGRRIPGHPDDRLFTCCCQWGAVVCWRSIHKKWGKVSFLIPSDR